MLEAAQHLRDSSTSDPQPMLSQKRLNILHSDTKSLDTLMKSASSVDNVVAHIELRSRDLVIIASLSMPSAATKCCDSAVLCRTEVTNSMILYGMAKAFNGEDLSAQC